MRESGHLFALLQEPYADNFHRITGFPAGMRVFADRRAGAAVIVDDPDAICMPVEPLVTEFGVCVSVTGRFGTIFLSSVYCQFSVSLEPYIAYMDEVLLLASSSPVIIGTDANAASPMWFSKLTHQRGESYLNYSRGELLSEWMVNSPVGVLNVPCDKFTFDSRSGRRSDIDITIVNNAASMFATYDWRVDEWDMSDHNIVNVTVTPDPDNTVESFAPVPSWNLNSARWRLFGDEVARKISELPVDHTETSLDHQVSALRSVVHDVCDLVLGRRSPRAKRRVVWWNAELSAKRREVRRLRRRLQDARRRGHDDDAALLSVSLRTASADYKMRIHAVKEKDWRDFVGRNSTNDPWGAVYRICRGRKKDASFGCLRSDGRLVVTWHDCAELLLRNFFPVAESNALVTIPSEEPPSLESFEVDTAIARLRSRRSPGMDGITGRICKEVWRAIPQHMTALYARCITEGYFPDEWKRPRVVALLKGPDKDRSDPGSYRGICLLPVFGKVLEGIMVTRLRDVLPAGCRWQFGFQPGRCVEDAWRHVVSSVAASPAKYLLGIFVDFKGAFDHVEWNAALRHLVDLGCREASLWRSFFCGRSASIVSRYGEASVPVTRGCPQGSISGPFIWNMVMDTLLQRLEAHCVFSAYADDLLLLVEGSSRLELESRGEQLMSIVGAWGAEIGVAVSTSKTACMMLKGRFSANRHPAVRFAGASLQYVAKYRYLGITVSERMSYHAHVSSLRSRLAGVVGALARVLRVDWGVSPRDKRTIYAGLMVPCALFGASVWYGLTDRQTGARKHLNACQRLILLGCLPVCRTVSTLALQVLAGAPPFDLAAKKLAIMFKLKRNYPLEEGDWLFNQDLSGLDWEQKKARIDECLLGEWQRRWDDGDTGRVTHEFFPDASFVYCRRDFRFTLRAGFLLTGHGSLNAFLHGRNLSETPTCTCGADREDWLHVLCVCPLYADMRFLDGLGIRAERGIWRVAGVTETQERMQLLDAFADAVFTRRRQIAEGVDVGGPPVPG